MSIKERVANFLRTRPRLGRLSLKVLPDIRWNVKIDPIGKFTIRLRRHRSYWLRDPLCHDGFMFGAFQRLVNPGDVVYDVGANIGLYSRFLATCFAAREVVGFEPMRANFQLLSMNAKHDREVAGRIRPLALALGDSNGEATLQIDDMSSQTAVLDSVTEGKASQGRRQYGLAPITETVSVRTLDQVMAEYALAPPQMVKIDIEGAGAMAVAGAKSTLARYKPKLLVELHGEKEGRGVWSVLAELGYHCFGYVAVNGALTYKEIQREDIREVGTFWSPHHLVASCQVSEVEPLIEAMKGHPPRRVWSGAGA